MGLALAVWAGLATGCKKDKPNANRDLEKNQKQVLDQMDQIAKQIEAEEKAKAQKNPGSTTPPAQDEQKKPAAPDPEPKKDTPPADKKPSPGGG